MSLVAVIVMSCQMSSALPSVRITPPTDDSLRARIERRIAEVPGATVGVAFRDLARGDTLFVGADERFHAASTMKVPVMIELFRQVDRRVLSLSKHLELENDFKSIVDGSSYQLSAADDSDSLVYRWVGSQVSVHDLLEHMITRSSNLATNTLIGLVGAREANATAHSLGARDMQVLRGVEDGKAYAAGMNNMTTARDLATLMTAIESGAAASRASTDSMRAILLRQEFNDEIPAGVPSGTPVAHKTGQITGHLHDTAIVYPQHRGPYVLVVLTRGIDDEKVARSLIADISRLVYDHATRGIDAAATREVR
ncbi:MAG TPA: serine hydrolase [Gemmatimonadaceae bacterium]|nr:serine hydrolase [Gemmatimonadaceae bacterium]